MPRRMITSDIWFNEKVATLPDAGRLLFIGIFSNADDDGRLKASAKFLKAHIFPYDNEKTTDIVRELRDKCAQVGLIRLYTNGIQELLDIPGWHEHQKIRKDRYNPSNLLSFELATKGQPPDTQPTTEGRHSIGEGRGVKSSVVKSKQTPKVSVALSDPTVGEIFTEMKSYLGYPDRVKKDPIPSYGKEGQAIKRMLARGFTREEVTGCWKQKVDARGGEFVSMTWVNEDIGKEGGKTSGRKGVRPRPAQERLHPIKRISGDEGGEG